MQPLEKILRVSQTFKNELMFRDANPVHIREFAAHSDTCRKSMPLQWSIGSRTGSIPNWGNLGIGFEITADTWTCLECHGTETKKR